MKIQSRPIWHIESGRARRADDEVLVEEPLEIRVAGDTLAFTMRTPGDDHPLALGFLFSEGIIASLADVGSVVHCGRPGEEGYGNVIDIAPGPGVALDPDRVARSRRAIATTAACGVCGRRSIDDLLERARSVPPGPTIPLARLLDLPAELGAHQPAFSHTGGSHGAAAFDGDGHALVFAEDVGRHNAVDKVIGRLLLGGALAGTKDDRAAANTGTAPNAAAAPNAVAAPSPASLLLVSGRISFEIVQKAVAAGIGFVAGVSAPSSLALSLAERAGVTVAGFVRGGRANIYTHPSRLDPEPR